MKPELLEKFPDATPYDLIKEASNAWSSLSKEKKDSYSTYMRKRESEHTNPSSPESLLQKYSKLHRKKLLINNLKYVIKKVSTIYLNFNAILIMINFMHSE